MGSLLCNLSISYLEASQAGISFNLRQVGQQTRRQDRSTRKIRSAQAAELPCLERTARPSAQL
jgi:hypothetical protein